MWGLFAGLCYSHQLGVVKSECCFTAATLRGLQTSAQTGLISLPLSVHFNPVFLATLAPLPPFPLTVSDTTQLSAHSLILLSYQKHSIWCLDREPVCHLPSRPACLHLDWPHNESWAQTNHVGPDVPPQVCRVKEKHLVTDCSLCFAAVRKTLRHEPSWTSVDHRMPC